MVIKPSLIRCFSTTWRSPCSSPAKHADLGKLIDTIHDSTPDLLRICYPDEIIHRNISLHVFPGSQIHLPTVTGKHAYKTSIRLVQFLVTTLLVPSSSDLVILSSRLDYPSLNSDHRHEILHKHCDMTPGGPELHTDEPPRLVMRWRTVSPASPSTNADEQASFMKQSWSSSLSKVNPINLGIHPKEYPVLTGIFEFDFDGKCTSIISHTITDVEYISNPEEDTSPIAKPLGT